MTIPWYHKTSIYQIYPRSFYDTNGDGIGDLKGILQKLDYLHDLGFETLWISPFFSSPQADFGYDISEYTSIAFEYGTMEDALQLIDETHKRDMKVVFDMVMNHTSSEHGWFKESRSSRDNSKADWYIWRDQPNNWQSMTGGSGWHFSRERGQYYWSSFLPFQPDLNYRNPEVKKIMFDMVRFWLDKGVDGFRLDIFNVLYKDDQFRDNPFTLQLAPTETNPSGFFQEAKYTLNQPECFDFAKDLRAICDGFGEKMLLGEISGDRQSTRKFLGQNQNDGLTQAFDFGVLDFKFTARFFRELIGAIETHFSDPFMPVYVFSNHDRRRSIQRLGNDMRKARLLHMLQLTVRGVPCIYYGEEIGMTDRKFPFASALDPIPHKFKFLPRFIPDLIHLTINRDEVRTPMQWDGTRNAGFSSAEKTWLPVHENYTAVNVERESLEEHSLLNTIRELMKIRNREAAIQEGLLHLLEGLPEGVLGYERRLSNKSIFVFLNFSEKEKVFQFESSELLFHLSKAGGIHGQTIQLNGFDGMMVARAG
ncbi:MAG: alpha-glucosidase [Chloroflexi bacterium]|nr:alpha-glucosidase [Chloroflexota bacterium]